MEDKIAREAIMHLIGSMVAGNSMSIQKFEEIKCILNKDLNESGVITTEGIGDPNQKGTFN